MQPVICKHKKGKIIPMRNLFWLSGPLCSFFLVSSYHAEAQQKPPHKDSPSPNKSSHWQAGVTYQSDDVYLGRKDSASVPYITPSIGYHDKSGLFIAGSVSYLPGNGENRIDVSTLEGGYSYSSDNFNAEFSAAKDFFSDQSFAVNSEIMGRLSASLSYDFGFIEPSFELGANFSDKPDFGLGIGVEHSFSVIEDRLEIDPAFHVNAASQNYYANYYNKRRYSNNRKGNKHGGTTTSTVTAGVMDASRFQIMDYELSAPIEYTMKKWKFNFSPTLAIPVNPSVVTITSKPSGGGSGTSQTSTESLSNTFFWTLGVSYTF